ncbi:MAG: hypothetical protein ACLP0J_05175 [Solirubrobacteraceae bacterium]
MREAVAAFHPPLGLLEAGPGGDDLGVQAAVVCGFDEGAAGAGEVLMQAVGGVGVAGGAEVVAGVAGACAARDARLEADQVDRGGVHATGMARREPVLSPSAARGTRQG